MKAAKLKDLMYDPSLLDDFKEFDMLSNQHLSTSSSDIQSFQKNQEKLDFDNQSHSKNNLFSENSQELVNHTNIKNKTISEGTKEINNQTDQYDHNVNNNTSINSEPQINTSYSFFDKYLMIITIIIFALLIEILILFN